MVDIALKPEVDDAYVVYCCKCGKPIEPEYEDCICIDKNEQVYICLECCEESQENGHVDLM